MSKLNLNDVKNITGNPTSAEQTINSNNDTLEEAFDNTLSRDGTGPNYMDADLDMNSNRIINLGAPAAPNDAARFKDLTNLVTIDDLVVPPLDGNEDKYLGTDGSSLVFKDFFGQEEQQNIPYYPETGQEIALGITVVDYSYPELNAKRYGASGAGVQSEATQNNIAFQAIADYLCTYGGKAIVPAGQYWLSTRIDFDGGDGVLGGTYVARPNVEFSGYGAEILFTSAVVGSGWRFNNFFPPSFFKVEGFKFSCKDNSTLTMFFNLGRASNIHLKDMSFDNYNTSTEFVCIRATNLTAGIPDTGCFWNTYENLLFRPVDGSVGTRHRSCIQLRGSANHSIIENCKFGWGVYGVELLTDGVGVELPNHVVIQNNAFEGINTAIRVVAAQDDVNGYWPTGLKVTGNRFELLSHAATFELMDSTNPSDQAYNHSTPPYFANNFTAGDVSTWIYNPHNAFITTIESRFYGEGMTDNTYASVVGQTEYVGGSKRLRFGLQGNLVLQNHSNLSNWASGHLVLGDSHLWYEPANDTWRVKANAAPTSATDGVAIGGSSSSSGTSGVFTASAAWDNTTETSLFQVSVRWAKSGDIVVLRLGGKDGTLTTPTSGYASGSRIIIGLNSGLPVDCRPKVLQRLLAISIVNGVWQPALWEFDSTTSFLYAYSNTGGALFPWNTPGCGFPGTVLTYNTVA